MIFRVAQEALTKVTRHAQARSVEVWLHRTGDAVCLRVLDDGQGIRGGMSGTGLRGMRERALFGGGQASGSGRRRIGDCRNSGQPAADHYLPGRHRSPPLQLVIGWSGRTRWVATPIHSSSTRTLTEVRPIGPAPWGASRHPRAESTKTTG